MYNYNDFKDNIDLKQFVEIVKNAQNYFCESNHATLGELIKANGCDVWMKIACVDKLVELGYIAVVEENEVSQFTTYRNIRL